MEMRRLAILALFAPTVALACPRLSMPVAAPSHGVVPPNPSLVIDDNFEDVVDDAGESLAFQRVWTPFGQTVRIEKTSGTFNVLARDGTQWVYTVSADWKPSTRIEPDGHGATRVVSNGALFFDGKPRFFGELARYEDHDAPRIAVFYPDRTVFELSPPARPQRSPREPLEPLGAVMLLGVLFVIARRPLPV